MGLFTNAIGAALGNRKSTTDFMKEKANEDAAKRAQGLAEKQAELNIKKTEKEITTPASAFEGTGFDAQIANEAYKYNISKGMDPTAAKQQAINMVLGSKQTPSVFTDPVTNQRKVELVPRAPVFPNSVNQIAPISEYDLNGGYAISQKAPASPPPPSSQGVPQLAQAQENKTKNINLYELAPLATGIASGAKDIYSRTAGQVDFLPVAEKTLEARQTIETETANLINAIRQNPRFSEGERNALEKQITLRPSVFDSPRALQARMRSINQSLKQRLDNEKRAANDETLPVLTRQSALETANSITNFLNVLGAPENAPNISNELPSSDNEDYINQILEMYVDE